MPRSLLLLVVFAACSKLIDLKDVTYEGVDQRELVAFPVTAIRDLDLLFLIDDSPSTADKQGNLASSFPKFIAALQSFPGGLPNVHIGVATSDMGTQGALDTNPSFGPTIGAGQPGTCAEIGKDGQLQTFGAPVTGPFIVDIADPTTGGRTRNYTGDLATVFGQIATGARAQGCGFEQPLAAAARALTNPANKGSCARTRTSASSSSPTRTTVRWRTTRCSRPTPPPAPSSASSSRSAAPGSACSAMGAARPPTR